MSAIRNAAAALAGGVSVIAVPYAWVVAASAAYCNGVGLPERFVFPFNQWLEVLPVWRVNWWVSLWVIIGAAAPTAALLLMAYLGVRVWQFRRRHRLTPSAAGGVKPTEPGVTDNHGHSQWRSMEDAMELFPGPDPTYGGIVVGEAYRVDLDKVAKRRFLPHDRRTWGKGGTAPLLIDPCNVGSPHSLIFAGTRSFKTVCAVSTILTWIGSSVIFDPSAELGPMLARALDRQHKDVWHIGIAKGEDDPATGFNVLAWIDITHPESEEHVKTVVGWIYDAEAASGGQGKAEDPFFGPRGRDLITCLLAHLVWCDPQAVDISLATFAEMAAVSDDDMLLLLAGIRATSRSHMARRLAGTLMGCKAPETFSGILQNAAKGIAWLFTGTYSDLVSAGSFDPKSLLNGRTTVFLNISLRTLDNTPAIARVLVGALLNTIYMAEGKTKGRILFLVDEAARLGRLKALETARDTVGKYNVALHLLFQSIGQMQDPQLWGREGTKAWIDGCGWVGYAAIRAGGAGKDLAEQLGAHGVMAYSEGDNQGRNKPFGLALPSSSRGTNVNVHEIRRSLIQAAEMQQDLRSDEMIVVPAQGMPIRCGRALYFRRPEFNDEVDANRFNAAAE